MKARDLMHFDVVVPRQSAELSVFTFAARAADVERFARIERAGRDEGGALQGFQRPQIASHVKEIRDYLEKPGAILPNPIVVAFTGGARLETNGLSGADPEARIGRLTIDVTDGAHGWIVDGQQRFTALSQIVGRDFEVLVSGFLCEDLGELQKQFILINNTRPLPKALIYELLPQVEDLPPRMSNRSQAAVLTEALNYKTGSSLRGMIRQQTNPRGVIRDTVLQRVIMNSLSDGALRLYATDNRLLVDQGYELISEFFHAVRHVFFEEWEGRTPKTSRLVHGTGIVAMGFVMEALHGALGASDRHGFAAGLRPLVGRTAWTSGEWAFGDERRQWNGLQNVPRDIKALTRYLLQELKRPIPRAVEAA